VRLPEKAAFFVIWEAAATEIGQTNQTNLIFFYLDYKIYTFGN
jgi:hypothetical protein